jgi:hypothetical protein
MNGNSNGVFKSPPSGETRATSGLNGPKRTSSRDLEGLGGTNHLEGCPLNTRPRARTIPMPLRRAVAS